MISSGFGEAALDGPGEEAFEIAAPVLEGFGAQVAAFEPREITGTASGQGIGGRVYYLSLRVRAAALGPAALHTRAQAPDVAVTFGTLTHYDMTILSSLLMCVGTKPRSLRKERSFKE